jgi:hypothetical protein
MSRSLDRALALIDAALGVPMRQGFVIHHNGPPANCLNRPHSRCIQYWNAVRSYHVDTRGWSDIAYSFGVCPHGTRFVGRGWDKPQFANGADVVGVDNGKDSEWYTVLVFLGWEPNAEGVPVDEEPTPQMVEGVRNLIAEGRAMKRCGRGVLPHNAFKIKRCPGAAFTELAAEWHNAPLTSPTEPAPVPRLKDPEMYVVTCAGKPTRLKDGPTCPPISKSAADAAKAAGVPVIPHTDADYEWLLRHVSEALGRDVVKAIEAS